MMRSVVVLVLVLLLAVVVPAGGATSEEHVKGYAEWRRGDILVVEGQLVRAHAGTQFKGDGIRALDSIALGFEVEAKGERDESGVIVAREIKAKPNGNAMFEADVLEATDEIERVWVDEGRMFEPGEDGQEKTIGRIIESGPQADRVRAIVDRLVPPYLEGERRPRVHLVETEEWNAAAMGNGAIWVYTGLIESMSDDELAIVLGHELAHYTHEHSRRQAKSSMWQGLLGLGALVAAEALEDDTASTVATVAAGLGLTVWSSGYSRDLEDQADRVGLRYAHEGGFDVGAGTRLWGKFRDRYGESDSVTNFFAGSHSRPSDRIRNIERELDRNYPSRAPWSFEHVEPADETGPPEPAGEPDSVDSKWVDQVRAQLGSFRGLLGDSFEPTSEPFIDDLASGRSVTLEFRLRRGTEVVIYGVCDTDCGDLDLFAYDTMGREAERDIEPDDTPLLQVEPREDGVWEIRVEMVSCSASTCVFGVQAYAR